MTEVAVRDLRNQGGKILDRVAGGEALTSPATESPSPSCDHYPRRPLAAAILLQRWRGLPAVDPMRLRVDIDELLDPSL